MTVTKPERRAAPRRGAHYAVKFWNERVEGTGFAIDLSTSGMFVETRQLLRPGTRVHLEVAFGEAPFYAEGVVARAQRSPAAAATIRGNGIGVRIIPWSAADRSRARSDDGDRAAATPQPAGNAGAAQLKVDLRDPHELRSVFAAEISRGGLFLPLPDRLPLGSAVVLDLELPAPHPPVQTPAKVVFHGQAPVGVGLQLTDVERVRREIAAVLAAAGA
ncbi:MAG: PilZ domain-containing protein [Deltaproteobacteria bacterium]|nr:PilZ domain-containing protein [Deltaproteobacteria bacterium]